MIGPLEQDVQTLGESLIGQVLPGSDGRFYPLRERIGEGGQGWVFRATWSGSVDVVVKVLRPDTANQESLARFQREAQVLRTLSQQTTPNPHIVRFYDHAYARVTVAATSKSFDVPFTVLEFVDGETLEKALERVQPSGLGLERTRRILRHVTLALQDVHAQNIVHRDLKPSNILLSSPGGRELAKVTDFGLAKMLDPGMQRTTHLAGATVGYAPPEQFENGNRRVGRQTDVFALAAIFYELICGRPAFPLDEFTHPLMVIVRILNDARPAFARVRDQLPRELADRPDVIAALDAELHRALSPEPGERHPTVMQLHQALERPLSTIASPPSVAFLGPHGGLVVQSGPRMGVLAGDMLAAAKTLPVEDVAPTVAKTAPMLPVVPAARPSNTDLSRFTGPTWRRVTAPQAADAWLSIAVAPSGDRAIAVGSQGASRWDRGVWTAVELPPECDASRMQAVAWHEGLMVFAGAWPIVAAVPAVGSGETWRLDKKGLAFHGAFADADGILLAGERRTKTGTLGVVAEIPLGARGGQKPTLLDVPGCGALRAVTRLGKSLLACGEAGALAIVPAGAGSEPRLANVCQPALQAIIAMPDGTAIAVGGGGFAFRVWPTLEVQLEAIQTTKDLFALARAPDGTLYCGGAGGRVLRRESQGWVRVGGNDGDGKVRAIHAGSASLVTFGDDGGVAECAAR